MGKYKRIIGFCLGILLGLLIWFVPLTGLSPQGHACLALS